MTLENGMFYRIFKIETKHYFTSMQFYLRPKLFSKHSYAKIIFLQNLLCTHYTNNFTLIYLISRIIMDEFPTMAPIIYTPTVGWACQNYSHLYRCYIQYFNQIKMLVNADENFTNLSIQVETCIMLINKTKLFLGVLVECSSLQMMQEKWLRWFTTGNTTRSMQSLFPMEAGKSYFCIYQIFVSRCLFRIEKLLYTDCTDLGTLVH